MKSFILVSLLCLAVFAAAQFEETHESAPVLINMINKATPAVTINDNFDLKVETANNDVAFEAMAGDGTVTDSTPDFDTLEAGNTHADDVILESPIHIDGEDVPLTASPAVLEAVQFPNVAPAVQGAVSAKAISTIVNHALPKIFKKIKELNIPGAHGKVKGFKWEIKGIKIRQLSYKDFTTTVLSNGFGLHIKGLHVAIHLNWKFKKTKFPWFPRGHGRADITIDASDIGATLQLNAIDTPQGPRAELRASAINVNLNQVKIKIHGGIIGWFMNLIIKHMNGKIKKAVQAAISKAIGGAIRFISEKIMRSMPHLKPIAKWGLLDMSLTSNAAYFTNQQQIMLAYNGEIYPANTGKSDGVVPRTAMQFNPSGRMIDINVNEFVLNSAFHAYSKMVGQQEALTNVNKPANFPYELTTKTFEHIPAMNMLGNSEPFPVEVIVKHTAEPRAKFTPDSAAFKLKLDIAVKVKNGDTAFTAFVIDTDVGAGFNIGIKNSASHPLLIPSILPASLSAKIKETKVGEFDVDGIMKFLASVVNQYVLPPINAKLAEGIALPSIAGMNFVNTGVKVNNGYFHFQSDLSFTAPKELDCALDGMTFHATTYDVIAPKC